MVEEGAAFSKIPMVVTMTLGDLSSPRAVVKAMEECDDLGREAFLDKHGFRPAESYFVVYDGQRYDSKAIAGVAFKYQHPEHGPLDSSEFSGGRATVKPKLESLGFTVEVEKGDNAPIQTGGRAPNSASSSSGTPSSDTQGYSLTAEERRLVEMHAVKRASEHFRQDWDTVEDVGTRESYDLHCKREGDEFHVEVKGTTGAGDSIILTANEVEHARNWYPKVALVIVSEIELDRSGSPPQVSGGEKTVYDPWDIQEWSLSPTKYDCRRPS